MNTTSNATEIRNSDRNLRHTKSRFSPVRHLHHRPVPAPIAAEVYILTAFSLYVKIKRYKFCHLEKFVMVVGSVVEKCLFLPTS